MHILSTKLYCFCIDIQLNPGPNVPGIKSLNILHLNTRSIRNKIDNIRDLADDFHIICLTDTHLGNSIDSASIHFQGFDPPIRKDRSQNCGVVMIYMSSLLKYTRREDLKIQRLETVWIEVNLKPCNALVCCFYRSDFTASELLFISELQESIETVLDFTPYVILAGKINIDFLTLINMQLRDFFSLFNLTNVIKEPTRITPNSSTLVDPVIVSNTWHILDSGTIAVESEKATIKLRMSASKVLFIYLSVIIGLFGTMKMLTIIT